MSTKYIVSAGWATCSCVVGYESGVEAALVVDAGLNWLAVAWSRLRAVSCGVVLAAMAGRTVVRTRRRDEQGVEGFANLRRAEKRAAMVVREKVEPECCGQFISEVNGLASREIKAL